MIRIVFIEDDSIVMSNLRRTLSIMRREWDMKFYASGEEALIAMAQRPFDVVVADFEMPGMSGSEVLTHVQYNYSRVGPHNDGGSSGSTSSDDGSACCAPDSFEAVRSGAAFTRDRARA